MTNKTQPSESSVGAFIESLDLDVQTQVRALIETMHTITELEPKMWGTSIIGFGSKDYRYETGRHGTVPLLSFSPRKTALTIYINEGFDGYSSELGKLGTFTNSISCLYIKHIDDVDIDVLERLLKKSFDYNSGNKAKIGTVDEYISSVPRAALPHFSTLRQLVKEELPQSNEVLSYGILGYKIDDKRARVFVSGWKDHVAMYPIPKNKSLITELQPYIRGKGTLWFPLNEPLPERLIRLAARALVL